MSSDPGVQDIKNTRDIDYKCSLGTHPMYVQVLEFIIILKEEKKNLTGYHQQMTGTNSSSLW